MKCPTREGAPDGAFLLLQEEVPQAVSSGQTPGTLMNSVQISREMLEGTIKLVSAKSMPSFLIAVSKTL